MHDAKQVFLLEFYPGNGCNFFVLIFFQANPTLLLASVRCNAVYRCVGENFEGKTMSSFLCSFF